MNLQYLEEAHGRIKDGVCWACMRSLPLLHLMMLFFLDKILPGTGIVLVSKAGTPRIIESLPSKGCIFMVRPTTNQGYSA